MMTSSTRNHFAPVHDLDRIPSEVATSGRAVLWNLEQRDGKLTKVPYVSRRPAERASVSDAATWSSFAEARAAVEDGKADGVGIVLGGGLIGIDIDDCRDPETGTIDTVGRAIIDCIGSYTEITPSGCGLHILVHGVLPPIGRRKGNIEMYDEGRYFTVTGNHVEGTPTTIEERTPDLAALHAQIFGSSSHTNTSTGTDIDDAALLERSRNALNGAAFVALWDGDISSYASRSEADFALCGLLASWTRDPARIDRLFRQSGLMRPKWDEARGDRTYGQRTIDRVIAPHSNERTRGDNETREADRQPARENQATQLFHLAEQQPARWLSTLDKRSLRRGRRRRPRKGRAVPTPSQPRHAAAHRYRGSTDQPNRLRERR